MRKIYITLLLLILIIPKALFSEISVESGVSKEKVSLDDTLEFNVVVTYDREDASYVIGKLIGLEFTNYFKIIKSPQSVRTFVSNNKLYSVKKYSFLLSPKEKGNLKIPSVSVPYTISDSTNYGFLQTRSKSIYVSESKTKLKKTVIIIVLSFLFVLILTFLVLFIIKAQSKRKDALLKEEEKREEERKRLKALYEAALEEEFKGDYLSCFEKLNSIENELLENKGFSYNEKTDVLVEKGYVKEDETTFYDDIKLAKDNFRFGKIAPEKETLKDYETFIKNKIDQL